MLYHGTFWLLAIRRNGSYSRRGEVQNVSGKLAYCRAFHHGTCPRKQLSAHQENSEALPVGRPI